MYLYLKSLQTVKELYEGGYIGGYNSPILGRLVRARPTTPLTNYPFTWAFDERATVVERQSSALRDLLCRLVHSRTSIDTSVSSPTPIPVKNALDGVITGIRGGGSMDPDLTNLAVAGTAMQQVLQHTSGSQPNILLHRPQGGINLPNRFRINRFQEPLVAPEVTIMSAFRSQPRRRIPKLVHLCYLYGAVTAFQGKYPADFLKRLDNIPEADIDEHAERALATTRAEATNRSLPIRCVSLDYPPFDESGSLNVAGSSTRYSLAFTSPAVMELTKGDIVYISNSSTKTGFPSTFPAVFDLAAYLITQRLEQRGVTVLFSAGGSRTAISDLPGLIQSTRSSVTLPLSGLVIGGVQADRQTVSSNYGSLVNCFLEPPTTDPTFGESSAATARMAGMLTQLQQYAQQQKQRWLMPTEIRTLLSHIPDTPLKLPTGQSAGTGKLPTWELLRSLADQLVLR